MIHSVVLAFAIATQTHTVKGLVGDWQADVPESAMPAYSLWKDGILSFKSDGKFRMYLFSTERDSSTGAYELKNHQISFQYATFFGEEPKGKLSYWFLNTYRSLSGRLTPDGKTLFTETDAYKGEKFRGRWKRMIPPSVRQMVVDSRGENSRWLWAWDRLSDPSPTQCKELVELARKDADDKVRFQAAWFLRSYPEAKVFGTLTACLNDKSARVRRAAGSSLAEIASPDAIEALANVAESGKGRFSDLMEAVAKNGSKRYEDRVVAWLKGADARYPGKPKEASFLKKVALDALAKVGTSRSIKTVKSYVGSPDLPIRIYALRAMAYLAPEDEAITANLPEIITVAKTYGMMDFNYVDAIDALGHLSDPRAVATLFSLLGSDDQYPRRLAIKALAVRRPEGARERILKLTKDEDSRVRIEAYEILKDWKAQK